MTKQEFEEKAGSIEMDDAYAEFLMKRCQGGGRIICNGDTLISAMEDGYLWEDFVEEMTA